MADGFLGRWSRRKAGKELEPPEKKVERPQASEPIATAATPQEAVVPPPPTLEDVSKIDRFDPDFSAFMRPDVDPAVQQAALKKMFSDPHFNIMDGLDIYIDDYSKPELLPAGMLKRLVQSDMLKLFTKSTDASDSEVNEGKEFVSTPQLDEASPQAHQSALTSPQSNPPSLSPDMPTEVPIEPEQKKT